jgi:predicted deacylase
VTRLSGTVVAVPCVNVPGYLRFQREFSDGKDLNRTFPGSATGTASSIYSHNLMTKIVSKFAYLIDLHTASFGRVNSYYVRSDMNDPVAATLAKLQLPQIILHNSGQDGTLRSAAAQRGIKAITVEIGNPQLFQNRYVQWSYLGVMRILSYLSMFTAESELSMAPNMLLCSRGFWIYTRTGGVLEVYPNVNTLVKKGDLIARYFPTALPAFVYPYSNPPAAIESRIFLGTLWMRFTVRSLGSL